MTTSTVLEEVYRERVAQLAKWGTQQHPDGTGSDLYTQLATESRTWCQHQAEAGLVTWVDILDEEFAEASAETDRGSLRHELIQVAAVAVAWVEDLDHRSGV